MSTILPPPAQPIASKRGGSGWGAKSLALLLALGLFLLATDPAEAAKKKRRRHKPHARPNVEQSVAGEDGAAADLEAETSAESAGAPILPPPSPDEPLRFGRITRELPFRVPGGHRVIRYPAGQLVRVEKYDLVAIDLSLPLFAAAPAPVRSLYFPDEIARLSESDATGFEQDTRQNARWVAALTEVSVEGKVGLLGTFVALRRVAEHFERSFIDPAGDPHLAFLGRWLFAEGREVALFANGHELGRVKIKSWDSSGGRGFGTFQLAEEDLANFPERPTLAVPAPLSGFFAPTPATPLVPDTAPLLRLAADLAPPPTDPDAPVVAPPPERAKALAGVLDFDGDGFAEAIVRRGETGDLSYEIHRFDGEAWVLIYESGKG